MSHQCQSTEYAVVMRMQGLSPASLGRFETHRERGGGDLGHVNHAKTKLNKRLIAFHLHAVIVPHVLVDVGVGRKTAMRERLQPSKHELIRFYEKAPDSVGEAFAGIGLVRGERRRAAYREAMQAGKKPAPYRAHVKTRAWRMAQELLIKEREAKVEAREVEADAILAVAQAVAAGDIDPEATVEALAAGGFDRSETAAGPPVIATGDVGSDAPEEPSAGDKVVATPTAHPHALAAVRCAVKKAPKVAGRAFTIFGRAWKALRGKAEAEAKQTVRSELNEIKAADKEINRIAVTLGEKDRARIASARGGLGKRIENIALRIARATVAGRFEKRRGRDDGRTDEKDRP